MNEHLNPLPPAGSSEKASFHIAFGADTYYFRGMGVTILSIIENNPAVDFVFHVFAFAVSDDIRRKLRQIEVGRNVSIDVHIIDPAVFDDYAKFPGFAQYSAAIFLRLLIPGALRGVTDRVLYLDADILCLGSVAELMAMDLSDNIVALIDDNGEETVRNQCANLNLSGKRYFNSGVLYINVANWLANDITQSTMRTILESDRKFTFPDQDALNIVLDRRATYVAGKWNFQYNLNSFLNAGDFRMNAVDEAIFIHFTGRVKPWHEWSLHEAKALFLKYQSLSPWADMALDMPKNYKEMRLFSQFLSKRGRKVRAALWFAKYLVKKLSTRQTYKSA